MIMKPPPPHSLSIFRPTIPFPFLLLALIFSATIFYSTDFCYISRLYNNDRDQTSNDIAVSEKTREDYKLPFAVGSGDKGCDLFNGRWVWDYSRPLYEEWECPYIGFQSSCLRHGRPEKDYQYWRWQPHGCSLPSFDSKLMLEGLRGKRIMFVGDSLNRGQFTSLVCLVQRGIPQHAKSMRTFGSLTVFTAKDYNARIEFYWAPLLLESNSDDPAEHRVSHRIIRNGTLDKHGQNWKEADIIVFNTYIWWVEGVGIIQGSFEDETKDKIVQTSMEEGYRIAMKMLVKWINENMDPKKTRLFFSGMSATHQASARWGGAPKGNCYNETKMLEDPRFLGARQSLFPIITQELSKSAVPITFLNITKLTSPRKDAHTSIHKSFHWGPLTEKQLANAATYADCIHWCLPGVQDVWNELLFAKLFYP